MDLSIKPRTKLNKKGPRVAGAFEVNILKGF